MAIIGGAGNPVGGSFTGPAEALEIYGDFAAAYSGTIVDSTSPITHLSFTTGNYLFVGEIQLNAAVDDDNPANGGASTCMITFNDRQVALIKAEGEQEKAPASVVQPVIIPAYTEVLCVVDSTTASGDNYTSVTCTGKIYRE